MKPILQTQLYGDNAIGNGNCVAAAMASILELPLWMMPPWEQMFARNDWPSRRRAWLATMLGLEIVCLFASRKRPGSFVNTSWEEEEKDYEYTELEGLPEFYIACGPTVRGSLHATVYSGGAMVHDPHYSADGLLQVERVEYFRALPAERRTGHVVPWSALGAPRG